MAATVASIMVALAAPRPIWPRVKLITYMKVAGTSGGPGYATDVPATFMFAMSFTRGQIGLGAASATIMLATVAAIVVPYLYSELRSKPHDR